jgi:hypothetical protein
MSNILFLLLFSPTKEIKTTLFMSLRKAVQILSCITISIITIYFLYELLTNQYDWFVLGRSIFLCLISIISGISLLHSARTYQFKYSFWGYVALCYGFLLHLFVIFANSCLLAFGIKFYHFYDEVDFLFFVFLTFWEFYYIWIVYNYTKQLEKGNDALVDGQNFDTYVVNFASSADSSINNISRRDISMSSFN